MLGCTFFFFLGMMQRQRPDITDLFSVHDYMLEKDTLFEFIFKILSYIYDLIKIYQMKGIMAYIEDMTEEEVDSLSEEDREDILLFLKAKARSLTAEQQAKAEKTGSVEGWGF